MKKETRAELRIIVEYVPGGEHEIRFGCDVQECEVRENGDRRYLARGTAVGGRPDVTAQADSSTAAMLAMFAQCLRVEQDLRDALAERDRDAWHGQGRAEFRVALAALIDEIDPGHAHDLSADGIGDATIDRLWRVGCALLRVVHDGCSILQDSGRRFFYIAEWCTKAGDACSGLGGSIEVTDFARQLGYLAKARRKLRPFRHPPSRRAR